MQRLSLSHHPGRLVLFFVFLSLASAPASAQALPDLVPLNPGRFRVTQQLGVATLEFGTFTGNRGGQDFTRPRDPSNPTQWLVPELYESTLFYIEESGDLVEIDRRRRPTLCVSDSSVVFSCLQDHGANFDCGENQGISRGWADEETNQAARIGAHRGWFMLQVQLDPNGDLQRTDIPNSSRDANPDNNYAWVVFSWDGTSLAIAEIYLSFVNPCPPTLTLEPVATGLARPVAITHPRDGSGRLFITQQRGKIVVFDGDQVLPTPFLDIEALVFPIGGLNDERGLLSAAFHPNYASNGYFYVNYVNTSNNTVIARYSVSAGDPNVADPNSAVIVMIITQPGFPNHKGGQLQFGPDGYLYIATGDGGGAGDTGNRAQNLLEVLGKMLRIDVNSGNPYGIPPDNPCVGYEEFCRPEIWSYGLRNPWRFSFDRLTGDLFIGDVGQNRFEEIDYQPGFSPGGYNYGWRLMEASACFNPPEDCNDGTLTLPILEYGRTLGFAVTGGYVYRGAGSPFLRSLYFYADYGTGRIWIGYPNGDGTWGSYEMDDTPYAISTFGEDETGELYFAALALTNGTIYRIAYR